MIFRLNAYHHWPDPFSFAEINEPRFIWLFDHSVVPTGIQ